MTLFHQQPDVRDPAVEFFEVFANIPYIYATQST